LRRVLQSEFRTSLPFGFSKLQLEEHLNLIVMSGRVKLNTESTETLKTGQQKTASGKERVQALYLLKTKQVETVQHLAVVLGRVTVQRWLSQYRSGGLNQLLEVGKSTGRTALIPEWAVERLKQELLEPEGFQVMRKLDCG